MSLNQQEAKLSSLPAFREGHLSKKIVFHFKCKKCGSFWVRSYPAPVIRLPFYKPDATERCPKCKANMRGTTT
jgi:hypothetical protein